MCVEVIVCYIIVVFFETRCNFVYDEVKTEAVLTRLVGCFSAGSVHTEDAHQDATYGSRSAVSV